MNVGMTLLTNDDSYDIVAPCVHWNARVFDKIACVADRPSLMLTSLLRRLESEVPNFRYLGPCAPLVNYPYDQPNVVNPMISYLTEEGMDWVINLDDDEFFLGDHVRDVLARSETEGFNALYTHGYYLYETVLDARNANPVRRMLYRDPDGVQFGSMKVMHQTRGFNSTTPGNHYISYKDRQVSSIEDHSLLIYHYTMRLKRQNLRNCLNVSSVTEQGIIDKGLVKDGTIANLFDRYRLPL